MDSIIEVLKNEEVWLQLFDIIRIIEPDGTHRVVAYQGKGNFDKTQPCYSFWERESHCANCISKRASIKQKAMMKLEYRDNRYYCVLSKPIEVHGQQYILELIMNISDQINNDEEDSGVKIYIQDLVERIENASSKDSFTKLYNKVYMKEKYENYVSDAARSKVYMALLDMNKFKQINDTYGHDCGDEVLLNVANLLKSSIPEEDGIVSRFGGDEFGILFASQDEEECRSILNRAKQMIDAAQYSAGDGTFNSGISYGLAEVKETEDFYEAIHEVDKRLYQVKHRDR